VTRHARWLLLPLLAAGCAGTASPDTGAPEEGDLVALDALAPTGDPGPLEPAAVRVPCVQAGWSVEGESFEVNTDACDPGLFEAPTLRALAAGDQIAFTRWHLVLDAPLPTSGRMALAIDDELLWSERFDIPAEEDVLSVEVEVEEAHGQGAPLRLLVENHGANSYRFTRLRWRAAPR
jgi:hypothetical protein